MTYAYPIMLDLAGETVVIIGGGAVAARKARGTLAAGAVVRVIAPRIGDEIPAAAQRVTEAYQVEHLRGARLVFAATNDSAVNDTIVRDARAAGIWVSRADSDEAGKADGTAEGDFVVPAKFDDRGVIVAVSAGSAAVSVAIRDRLAARFDPAWARQAEAMRNLRPLVLHAKLASARRSAILRELAAMLADSDDSLKRESTQQTLTEWLHRRLADEAR